MFCVVEWRETGYYSGMARARPVQVRWVEKQAFDAANGTCLLFLAQLQGVHGCDG